MTNSSGPNEARPDPHDAPQSSSADATSAARGASPDAQTPPSSGAGDAPEVKEKNKIFEAVRLKARLSMAEQEIEKLKAELEQLRAEPSDYQDRNMRLMADMENLRRRTERERADTAKFAITRFARDVLTVADTVQRAIDTVPKDAVAADGPLKNFFEGVELTGRELVNVLERHGVKRIDPTGMRFDPNHHQAMMQVDNADVPNGTVMQAFQHAYMIEDRILRPAMVVVSRGGPKVAKPAEGTEASADIAAAVSEPASADGTGGAGMHPSSNAVPEPPLDDATEPKA